jgi:hypothetical protein
VEPRCFSLLSGRFPMAQLHSDFTSASVAGLLRVVGSLDASDGSSRLGERREVSHGQTQPRLLLPIQKNRGGDPGDDRRHLVWIRTLLPSEELEKGISQGLQSWPLLLERLKFTISRTQPAPDLSANSPVCGLSERHGQRVVNTPCRTSIAVVAENCNRWIIVTGDRENKRRSQYLPFLQRVIPVREHSNSCK